MQDTNQEVQENLQNNNTESDSKSDSRFNEGDEIELVRVRFPGNPKSLPFLVGKRRFAYGQKVIAMSDRGMTVGYINSLPYLTKFNKDLLPLKSINKVATPEDIEEQKSYAQKENEAEVLCLNLIEKHNLDMNLTHVEFIQFGKKAVFYFTAPARVDFRGLVKDLVSDLKMRIELRQISVRDRAAAIGAVGVCGLQTCCSSFLKNYGNVSIKMPKNQNLALIPSKINGVCGQIKCCMKYEDDVYTHKRSFLPKEGRYIKTKSGDIGKVLKLQILIEQFDMLTDKGQIRRYTRSEYDKKKCEPPIDWTFPERFDHIVNETSNVIGQTEVDKKKDQYFENEYEDKRTPLDTKSVNKEEKETTDNPRDDKKGSRQKDDSRSDRRQRRPRNNKNNQRPNKEKKQESDSTNKSEDKKPSNRNKNKGRYNKNRNNRPKRPEGENKSDSPNKPSQSKGYVNKK